jgi:SAM-dependent methyltransferase
MVTKQGREQAFHDAAFSESTREHPSRFYEITRASGSGASSQAFFLASRGARVTGIDISPVAIEIGRRRALDEGSADRVTFERMDAESLRPHRRPRTGERYGCGGAAPRPGAVLRGIGSRLR